MARYILALTQRTTLGGKPHGVNHEFKASEAEKRLYVDNLKFARVVSKIDNSGLVSGLEAPAPPPGDLAGLSYNELRQLAKSLDLDTTGKSNEIRARIRAHYGLAADEEE